MAEEIKHSHQAISCKFKCYENENVYFFFAELQELSKPKLLKLSVQVRSSFCLCYFS